MNIFEFYRDSVFEWQKSLDPRWTLGATEEALLRTKVVPQFQEDCFNATPLDYSQESRRIAYGLHYAPKHAVIWREYLHRLPKATLHSVNRLNSIGTGPGSELIGILEGASNLEDSLEIVCFEREEAWRALLDVVLSRYASLSGVRLNWTFTNKLDELLVGAPTVGSCVMSELGRERQISSFLKATFEHVGGVRGRFLDFPCYPLAGRTFFIEDRIPDCQVIKLYEQEWDLCGTLNAEMKACAPCHCKVVQVKEPGLRMHQFRFK